MAASDKSSLSGFQFGSSSRKVESRSSQPPDTPGSVLTLFLLAVLLLTGPIVLGAARLWIELPLLVATALLLLVQGARLTTIPAPGALRQIDAIDLSVILFVIYTIVRWLTSPTEYFSRLEAMNVLAYAVIFFTCRYGLPRRSHGVILLWLLVILGVFETGFGYYLHSHPDFFPFGPTERLQFHYAPRWLGTYGCPNHYGGLLVMSAAAALALASFSKLSWPTRIVCFYLAAMIMIGIALSLSRGSWCALFASIIGLAIFAVRYGTLRWWIPIIGVLILTLAFGTGIVVSPTTHQRIDEIRSMIDRGVINQYVRVQLFWDSLHIVSDNPLWGTGPGTFVFVHPRYQGNLFGYKAILAHDDYLNCAADYGLVGFGIVMFFFWAVILKLFRRLRSEARWQDRVVVATATGAWFALAIHSFVDFNLHIPANAFMFFALIGLGLRRVQGEEAPRHWSTFSLAPLGRWLGLPLIVLSLGFGYMTTRAAISDIIYEKAFVNAQYEPTIQTIQETQTALGYDPGNARAWTLLGNLYRLRASQEKEIEGRVSEGQKALDAYQNALKANPLDDTVEALMGLTFDVMRRYSEAFFCYKNAVTAQPFNGQFWNALGNHYWQRGMLVKAEEAYLLAADCPHGFEKSAEGAAEIRKILGPMGVPPPKPGTNPLSSETEPATTP